MRQRIAGALATTILLGGCAGTGSNVQVDRTFANYQHGYLDAKLESIKKRCEDTKARTPFEVELCADALQLEKLVATIVTTVVANDNAQKALEARMMQLGLKAVGGL
jgi:hypothetical protein